MGIISPLFVMNIDFTSHGWASNSFYIHVTNETLWCNKVYYFTNICFIFIITKTPAISIANKNAVYHNVCDRSVQCNN